MCSLMTAHFLCEKAHNISMINEQKIIVLVVLLTAFITSFTGSALNLAIPDISEYYSANASLSGWIVTGYTLTVAAVSIPSGFIADRFGRKKILVTGLAAFTAASAAAVFSGSIMMLILSRALQGIGAAMIFSTNTAILAESFSGSRRGSVLGYALAATYVGLSAGPFLGGVINYNLGWRMIFAITGSVTLVTLLLAVRGVPAVPQGSKSTDRSHKFINLKIIKGNRPFICSSLAALINYGATFTVSYLLSIYLQVVMGYSSQTAGLILLVQPIIISILSPLAGKISDTVSPFKLSAIGMAVCAAGIATGLLQQSLITIIAVLAVVGAGSAFFSSPNTNAVMSCVDPEDYSFASSVLSTMRAAGNTLGMLLITAISQLYIGDAVLKDAGAQAVTRTMMTVLIISTSSCLVGVVLARVKSYNENRK